MAPSAADHLDELRCSDFLFRPEAGDQVTLGNQYADSIRSVEDLLARDLPAEQRSGLHESIRVMRRTMQEQGRFGDYVLVGWGGHLLRITALMTDQRPEDLQNQLQDSARRHVEVERIVCGGIAGVAYERHDDPLDGLCWWLAKGGCLICFELRGSAPPTAAAVAHVRSILATLVHAPLQRREPTDP